MPPRELREAVAFSTALSQFLLRSSPTENKVPFANQGPPRCVAAARLQHDASDRRCLGTVNEAAHNRLMRKGDIICPECKAGIRRIELNSRRGHAGEFRCPLCDRVLETSDGSTDIVYRLTVAPEKLFD
jgi:hypothetical protein